VSRGIVAEEWHSPTEYTRNKEQTIGQREVVKRKEKNDARKEKQKDKRSKNSNGVHACGQSNAFYALDSRKPRERERERGGTAEF